jgi:phosphate transport system protein
VERHFDEELKNLKQRLLQMADVTQAMIGLAVRILVERNQAIANEVFSHEDEVNHMEVSIEDEVLRLLALRQPAARDLRLLTAILKITNDLERIADEACNITEKAVRLLGEPLLKPLIDIPHMAKLAQTMVKDGINAFVNHDPKLAQEVCMHDDEVDKLNHQVFRELLTYMMENPKNVSRAVDLMLISRHLERIADHATNIGEDVVFIEVGKNIKHHLLDEEKPSA